MSHKAEKQALRDSYRGLVNRFKKKVEKSALPPAEKERRGAQRKANATRVPALCVSYTGKKTWKRRGAQT